MQQNRCRKTDRLSHAPLQPGLQCQMFPFNLLRMDFPNGRLCRFQMAIVHVCPIRIEMPSTQRCESSLYLSEDFILMCASHIGAYHARLMIKGMPEPSLLSFLPHNTPHVVDVCFFHVLDLNADLTWIDVLKGRGIDVWELMLFFGILA